MSYSSEEDDDDASQEVDGLMLSRIFTKRRGFLRRASSVVSRSSTVDQLELSVMIYNQDPAKILKQFKQSIFFRYATQKYPEINDHSLKLSRCTLGNQGKSLTFEGDHKQALYKVWNYWSIFTIIKNKIALKGYKNEFQFGWAGSRYSISITTTSGDIVSCKVPHSAKQVYELVCAYEKQFASARPNYDLDTASTEYLERIYQILSARCKPKCFAFFGASQRQQSTINFYNSLVDFITTECQAAGIQLNKQHNHRSSFKF